MSQKLRSFHFRPALLDSLKHYRRPDFMADLGAGLTVACVALPLAMAFGIASGVKPEQGLITAIIGGALVSLLGGRCWADRRCRSVGRPAPSWPCSTASRCSTACPTCCWPR